MKFSIKKPVLAYALDKASVTVSSKGTDPILRSFNIEADEDQIRILSTDLSLGLVAKIRVVDIEEPGVVCVPAQKLISIAKVAEAGDISIAVEGSQLIVTAGRARWQLNTIDGDYPEVPRFSATSSEEVNRKKLLNAILKVRYAASTDEVRTNLMLIAFDGERAAASDGSRLQLADFEGLAGVQIPVFAVGNLIKLMGKSEVETVRVEQKTNHLLFQVGADTFSARRLYEEFPDVEGLILKPAEKNSSRLVVDKEKMVDAVTRVKIAADPERKQLDLKVLSNGAGEVELRAVDPQGELAIEVVPCETDLEDGRLLSVNHQFFLESLAMSPQKQVTLLLGQDQRKRRSSIYMKEPGLRSVLLQLRPE